MSKSSFVDINQKLEEACEFLRFFTLGRSGYTQRDGVAGIQRVSDLCDRLKGDFGAETEKAAAAAVSGRSRIKAAEARLDLLRKRS